MTQVSPKIEIICNRLATLTLAKFLPHLQVFHQLPATQFLTFSKLNQFDQNSYLNFNKMSGNKSTKGAKASSSKEDDLILQDFSRRVSTKSSALFYGNAFIVSSVPIWLYWRIHYLDPLSSAFLFAIMTVASTWLMAFSYKNTKIALKHKVNGFTTIFHSKAVNFKI